MARRPIATVEFPQGMDPEPAPGLMRRVWRDSVAMPRPVHRGALEAWKHLREGEKVRFKAAPGALYSVYAECLRPVPTTTHSDLPALAFFRIYVEGESVEDTTLCPNCVVESVQAFPWEGRA